MSDRLIIDPANVFPADGLRQVDTMALRVIGYLPHATVTRTRDAIQIDANGAEGIVVLVTREALEFRLPTVEWTMGAYGPAYSSRLWKRVKADSVNDTRLRELLDAAQYARSAEFQTCRYCGQKFPPEHRINKNTCQSCASQYEHVVY